MFYLVFIVRSDLVRILCNLKIERRTRQEINLLEQEEELTFEFVIMNCLTSNKQIHFIFVIVFVCASPTCKC